MNKGIQQLFLSRVLIPILACTISALSYSQNENLTSLSFDSLKDSIEKYVQNDYEKGLQFSKAYLNKAKKEKDPLKEGSALEYIAASHLFNDHLKYARDIYHQYVQLAERKNNDELFIRAHALGSDIELNVPDGAKATKLLDIALNRAIESKNDLWVEIIRTKMALLLTINGETQKAIQAHHRTLQYVSNKKVDSVFSEKRKISGIINTLVRLCHSYREADKVDSARIYNAKIKPYLLKADSYSKMLYQVNSGENDYAEGNYADAKEHYEKSDKLKEADMPLWELNMAFRYGKIENKLGNYSETVRILKKGLDDYGVKPNEEAYMDEYYKILAEAYKETGDFEFANTYFEKYINTRKEYAQIQDDVNATIHEKELTAFQNELKKLEEEKKSKNIAITVLILGGSISILILLLLLLRFYRIRKKNEVRFEELMNKLNTQENKVIDSKDTELEESAGSDIATEVTEQILAGLSELESKNYFLKQECNSYNVAKKIKTNTSYLSKVVNQEFEKNFNTYINDLRINYAIVQLKEDSRFRSFSIQSIAEELGYKSADSFTKYFKLHTGLNPSFYIKQLNQL